MADAPRGAAAPIPSAALAAFPEIHTTEANPPDLLQQLASWMHAAGLDAGHPWRILIAQCLAKQAGCTRAPLFGLSGRLVSLEHIPAPVALLQLLDEHMHQAGYRTVHPWRVSMARCLAAQVESGDGAQVAGPAAGCGGHAPELVQLDRLSIGNALWDVHGLVMATSASAVSLADELGIDSESLEPLRRLCAITARMVESLIFGALDKPGRFYVPADDAAGSGSAAAAVQGGAA